MTQLDGLVEAGNTVIVVEHDMRVVAGERLGHRHRPRRRRRRRADRRRRDAGRGVESGREPHRAYLARFMA